MPPDADEAISAPPIVPAEPESVPVILGIDPGTRVLGYGALSWELRRPRMLSAGVIRANARWAISRRLGHLAVELERLFAEIHPGVVVVESAFASRNVRSALRLGEARGVVLACASRAGAEVIEMAPASAKKAVLGHGGASKHQVARMVGSQLGERDLELPEDATDALALALAHLHALASPATRARSVIESATKACRTRTSSSSMRAPSPRRSP